MPAAALFGLAGSVHAADVTVGFQLVYGPWKAKMEELKANGLGGQEHRVREVHLRHRGDQRHGVGIGGHLAQTAPRRRRRGYSRGVDLQVIYVYDNINNAEALVVDDSVTAPQDLAGKTIAVPFGSTTHFHMMFALEQFNISPKDLDVLDMSPPDMVAAWERGDINGGFVWDPALGRMKEKGRVLLTSGDLSNWGKATFDAMGRAQGVHRRESRVHLPVGQDGGDGRCRLSRQSDGLRPGGPATPWGSPRACPATRPRSPECSRCTTIRPWRSRSRVHGSARGVQNALMAASEFLMSQGKLDNVLDSYADSATPKFAQMVLDGGC